LAAYKPAEPAKVAADRSGLKPYRGKPAVRNFRGDRGNVSHGPVTICHAARKGGHTGSHWPTATARLSPTQRTVPAGATPVTTPPPPSRG
jgi:hypothetical protein